MNNYNISRVHSKGQSELYLGIKGDIVKLTYDSSTRRINILDTSNSENWNITIPVNRNVANDYDLTTKKYVDDALALKLNISDESKDVGIIKVGSTNVAATTLHDSIEFKVAKSSLSDIISIAGNATNKTVTITVNNNLNNFTGPLNVTKGGTGVSNTSVGAAYVTAAGGNFNFGTLGEAYGGTASTDGTTRRSKSIIAVKGTQTSATYEWTGNIDVDSVYDGMTIAYFLPRTSTKQEGETDVHLTLTLNNNSTVSGDVYYTGTTKATTHFGAGSTILLTYWSAGSISVNGETTTNNRWTRGDYNVDNDTKVRQTLRSGVAESKPILMSYAATSTTTSNIDNVTYRNNKVYITLTNPTGKETIYSPRGVFYDTTDLSGTANNQPALIVGGTESQAHMEFDANEIQGKTNGTTVGTVSINHDGGQVTLGKSKAVDINAAGTTVATTVTHRFGANTDATTGFCDVSYDAASECLTFAFPA